MHAKGIGHMKICQAIVVEPTELGNKNALPHQRRCIGLDTNPQMVSMFKDIIEG